MHNTLRKWLFDKGYVSKGRGPHVTHVCLDGGSFSVPDKESDTFLVKYLESLGKKEKLYFVEMKTPVFRMFVDMDLKDGKAYEVCEIQDIVQTVHMSIRDLFGNEREAVVCTTEPKTLSDGLVKTGVHILWDVSVDCRHAKLAAQKITYDLEEKYGPRQETNPWTDVVDSSVYREGATSLRMKGSLKKGEERVYTPSYILKEDTICPIEAPFEKSIMERCIVRLPPDTVPTIMDKSRMEAFIMEQEETQQLYKKHKLDDLTGVHSNDLKEFIRKSFKRHNIREFRKISRVKGKCAMVALVEAKYCLNLGREHKSNNVYFYISKDGVSQRCFCTCNTEKGRTFGKCKDFQSDPIPIPKELSKALFPAAKKKPPVKVEYTAYDKLTDVKSMEFLNSLVG